MEKKVAVIIPVYNEEGHIESSVGFIEQYVCGCISDYEFILIDDGSKDGTWMKISGMAEKNEHITAVRLSRNFGKEAALCAGIEMSDADAVIIMDSDLQHPPALIPEMVNEWKNGYDVVEGVKSSRGKEGFFYKMCSALYYSLIAKAARINLKNASDFKLLDRKVVEAWKQMPERTVFFRGMSAWLGFERKQLPFEVQERVDGKGKWSLSSLIKLAVSSITSYTSAPLHMVTFFGIITFIIALIFGIQTLYMKFSGHAMEGFTTVILLLLFIGSMIMISLGIIGLYIAKIYNEIKIRPRYLISRVVTAKAATKKREE